MAIVIFPFVRTVKVGSGLMIIDKLIVAFADSFPFCGIASKFRRRQL